MMGFSQLKNMVLPVQVIWPNYYAGICCLRTGKFEDAINYLSKYDNNDIMLAPIVLVPLATATWNWTGATKRLNTTLKRPITITMSLQHHTSLKKAGFAFELKGILKKPWNCTNVLKGIPRHNQKGANWKDIAKVKQPGNL